MTSLNMSGSFAKAVFKGKMINTAITVRIFRLNIIYLLLAFSRHRAIKQIGAHTASRVMYKTINVVKIAVESRSNTELVELYVKFAIPHQQ